jgi:hypothetical protein
LRPNWTAKESSIYMATEAQSEANKRNAQKSTGPRTDAGKARVSRNATRHGLCNTLPVMSDEDRAKFEEMLNDLNEEHQPTGTTEGLLVYKMAAAFLNSWRANILLTERLEINDTQDDSKQVALMLRYYNTADRAFNRNLHDLRNLQKERQKEEIGFAPQITQITRRGPEKPPDKPDAPPEIEDNQPDLSLLDLLDPEIEPLGGSSRWKSTVEPPKKAA